MITAKHTPLPWVLAPEADKNLFSEEISFEILDAAGFAVAELPVEPILDQWAAKFPGMQHWADGAEDGRTVRQRSEEELRANAAVILAASKMLALLQELEQAFGVDGHNGRFEDGECELIDRTRALIIEAGGVVA